jgi:hypothetical protein
VPYWVRVRCSSLSSSQPPLATNLLDEISTSSVPYWVRVRCSSLSSSQPPLATNRLDEISTSSVPYCGIANIPL